MMGYDELYVHCTSDSGKIKKRGKSSENASWTDFDWSGEDCRHRCGEPNSMQEVRNCQYNEQNFLTERTYENQIFCSLDPDNLSPIRQLQCAECQLDEYYNEDYYREGSNLKRRKLFN